MDNLVKVLVSVATALIIGGITSLISLHQRVAVMESQIQQTGKYIENKIDQLVTKDQNEIDKLRLRSEIIRKGKCE